MLNNPIRNVHTDYIPSDIFKPWDANTLAQSISYDYVITKEVVDAYREEHSYTQDDWLDVGMLLWGNETPIYPDGRTSVSVFFNFYTTVADRFDFGSKLSLLGSEGGVTAVHVYSLSSYRSKGGCGTYDLYHHTSGSENYVLFDGNSLYRDHAIYVGSFACTEETAMWYGTTTPFVYEQCLYGETPHGPDPSLAVLVRQSLWMSNMPTEGSASGGSDRLVVVDTDFTGHYYKSGSADGNHETKVFDANGTGSIPFRGIGILRGNGLESIESIFTYSSGEDKWFDGAISGNTIRALPVGSTSTIDVYTWNVLDTWATGAATKGYRNMHGGRVHYTYENDGTTYSETVSKPLIINATSLIEDKVYELKVHYMSVGSRATNPGWGTPLPILTANVSSNAVKIARHTFDPDQDTLENSDCALKMPVDLSHNECVASSYFVQFKNAQGSTLPIAKWALPTDSPATLSDNEVHIGMKYNLDDALAWAGRPLPEIAYGSTIFFKHGSYVYVMTY